MAKPKVQIIVPPAAELFDGESVAFKVRAPVEGPKGWQGKTISLVKYAPDLVIDDLPADVQAMLKPYMPILKGKRIGGAFNLFCSIKNELRDPDYQS